MIDTVTMCGNSQMNELTGEVDVTVELDGDKLLGPES